MIMNPSIELQKAVYQKLSQGPYTVIDIGTTNSTPAFPYILIGEEIMIDVGTKTERRTSHLMTIHCWSKYQGSKETKEMIDFVWRSLKDGLEVDGFSVDYIRLSLSQVMQDKDIVDDVQVNHGVVQIEFDLTEVE